MSEMTFKLYSPLTAELLSDGSEYWNDNVTVEFAKDDNPEVMKNVTDLIMSAYAERKAKDAQE